MENFEEKSHFETLNKLKRRRELLPWWIKLFCWLFMLFGIAGIICFILGLLGLKPNLSFYGFTSKEPISVYGILIIVVAIFKGITAYYLWSEKDQAMLLSKIDAIAGIGLCLLFMILVATNHIISNSVFRLEPLLLAFYLWKIFKIEKEWKSSALLRVIK